MQYGKVACLGVLVLVFVWQPAMAQTEIEKLKQEMNSMQIQMEMMQKRIEQLEQENKAKVEKIDALSAEIEMQKAEKYELGEGIKPFGEKGVKISGFSVVSFENQENENSTFNLKHLNIYLDVPLEDAFQAFGELEFEEKKGGDEVHTHFERGYLQWNLADWAKVRFGRTISPYSSWNLIHADPLLPTTTDPLLISKGRMMPHMLGVELSGLVFPSDWEIEYYLGVGNGKTGGKMTDVNANKMVYAATYFTPPLKNMGNLKLGVSTMSGKDEKNYRENMVGTSLIYTLGRLTLWGEYYRSWIDAIDGMADFNADAFYAMLLYKLTNKLTGIVRYEENDQNSSVETSDFNNGKRWVWGLNYKPIPAVAFKLEYILHQEEDGQIGNNSVVGSASVLF